MILVTAFIVLRRRRGGVMASTELELDPAKGLSAIIVFDQEYRVARRETIKARGKTQVPMRYGELRVY